MISGSATMTQDLDLSLKRVVDYGKQVDFGRTADDYGRYRAGYPDELYRRLAGMGIGTAGQRVLDIGTGTGFLGRGFARAGCDVVGLDISAPLMRQARELDAQASVSIRYVRARAEALSLRGASFDVVSAGQCWHWFDRALVGEGVMRVLVPDGVLLIANFDWIPLPGNVVEATESLIMKHNPGWKLGGGLGIHPGFARDVALAGFEHIETFSFDVMAPYSHEAWRGRIRASAGVGGTLKPEQVAAFDAELAKILRERFPDDPMGVHHRTFALICRAGPQKVRTATDSRLDT
jgi:SAM-dependent methyltransferase